MNENPMTTATEVTTTTTNVEDDNFAKVGQLLSTAVRPLVTFAMAGSFIVLSQKGVVTPENVVNITLLVLTFWFATRTSSSSGEAD